MIIEWTDAGTYSRYYGTQYARVWSGSVAAAAGGEAGAGLEATLPFVRFHGKFPPVRHHATSTGRLHAKVKQDP